MIFRQAPILPIAALHPLRCTPLPLSSLIFHMGQNYADPLTKSILLVKTSSLGDVLHNLPVVTDIRRHFTDARIDWLVEEGFSALPKLHPAVKEVIPVAVRRWRGRLYSASTWRQVRMFRTLLQAQEYDFAIDTQGLLKSALLMHGARGLRCGFDRQSARESLASLLYQKTFRVAGQQHAVERNRQLVAQALGYTLSEPADYGIQPPANVVLEWRGQGGYAVLLHATSRTDKLWNEAHWIALGRFLQKEGVRSILPWGSKLEQERSLRLAESIPDATVPPHMSLQEAAALLGGAQAIIGVDTGLAHLAAALDRPTVGLYTATDPSLTGLYAGNKAVNLGGVGQAPDVAAVIEALELLQCLS